MKNKYAWLVGLLLFGIGAESLLHINVYLLVLILVGVFMLLLTQMEKNIEMDTRKIKDKLSYEVRTSSKDAYLKYKQLVTTVSSIPFPMIVINQYGAIVMHNAHAEELTTGKIEEQDTYLKNQFHSAVQEFIKDAFIYEKKIDRILEVDQVSYQAWGVPITTNHKFSGCLLLFQNITKALEGEKMQKRFIADASHELKTPISVIKGMVEILNRDDFDDPIIQKDFLSQIASEVERLEQIVQDMLQLSKISVEHPLLERKKVHMNPLLMNALASMQQHIDKKGLHTKLDLCEEDEVFCDQEKMGQVILNLLSNACKYSDQGTITISTHIEERFYVISIQDEGCGLTNEQQEKIFDRFYRVDDDRSRKSGGTGLGLAIVKSIVDAHAGKIEIESAQGKGTTFHVYLKN